MVRWVLFSRDQVFTEMIPVALLPRRLQAPATVPQPQQQHLRQQYRQHLLVPQALVLRFGLAAALGAILGSLARLQISYWVQTPSQTSFPWSTFMVNLIGALLIGLVASSPKIMKNETRRHFVVTGVLGGFTTFSAIAVETLQLSSTPVISITYVVATFIVGIAATHLGSLLGDRR